MIDRYVAASTAVYGTSTSLLRQMWELPFTGLKMNNGVGRNPTGRSFVTTVHTFMVVTHPADTRDTNDHF